MAASTTMTIRITPELKEKLARLARATDRSSSYLAGEAVAAYVDNEWPIVEGILAAMEDVRAGNTVSHDEVVAEMNAIIDAARRKVA